MNDSHSQSAAAPAENELARQPPLIRCGTTVDVAGVCALELRYFITALTLKQRENGFISVLNTEEWFTRIAAAGGLHVPVDSQQAVVRFIVIAPPTQEPRGSLLPISQRMAEPTETLEYRGRRVSSYKNALRGPVCIDEHFRGHGPYNAFNSVTKAAYRETFEIGVLFVSAHNPRSLRTTTTKLQATSDPPPLNGTTSQGRT